MSSCINTEGWKEAQRKSILTMKRQKLEREMEYNISPKLCKFCSKPIKYSKKENNYCSRSCGAHYSNAQRKTKKETRKCLFCEKETINSKFCSIGCSKKKQKEEIFSKIENGDVSLYFRNYKHYLVDKFGCKCMLCGWDKINPVSDKCPIELDHINGNSEDNRLENLRLICPNCHSLQPTYKSLNKGKGRHFRRQRYSEGKSY